MNNHHLFYPCQSSYQNEILPILIYSPPLLTRFLSHHHTSSRLS